jgi:alpha-tubulin suppressor-like RCC1 family protein
MFVSKLEQFVLFFINLSRFYVNVGLFFVKDGLEESKKRTVVKGVGMVQTFFKGKVSVCNKMVCLLWSAILVALVTSGCESLGEKDKESTPPPFTTDPSTMDTSTSEAAKKAAPRIESSAAIPKVYAGVNRTCIVKQGAVSCWGIGLSGRLAPTPISGWQSDVVDIGVGEDHSCAVFADGRVECLGQNMFGQLGNRMPHGSSVFVSSPVQMAGLVSKSIQISSNHGYSCVVTEYGDVECWGLNNHLRLGDRTAGFYSATPVHVSNLGGPVSKVVSGSGLACALLVNGTVECWGDNSFGQLGVGQTKQLDGAQKILLTQPYKAIDVSVGASHACALLETGQVHCWGEATSGQVGIELWHPAVNRLKTGPAFVAHPTLVNLAQVQTISANGTITCALTVKGEVFCWGSAWSRSSAFPHSDVPVQVPNLTESVKQISVGGEHICAVLQSGKVVCWGDNNHGILGDVTQKDRSTPIFVKGL